MSVSMQKELLKIVFITVLVYIAFGYFKSNKATPQQLTFQPVTQEYQVKSVTATSTTKQISSNTDACSTNPTYLCFADYYKKLTQKSGALKAIDDMKVRAQENPIVLGDCHPLMHVIGRTAAENYPSVSQAFAHGDPYCWSGYYHGIMEGIVDKIGIEKLPTELNNICAEIPGKEKYTFDYFNCVHGLGHGIMALLDDDVFKSLNMCDNVSGDWEQNSCYSGVFMQNIIDSTNVADTNNTVKDLKPDDPMYPCNAVATKYKNQCYLGQTSYALQVTNYNFSKVFSMCQALDEPYRDICNQSMGRDVANQSNHQSELTKTRCDIPGEDNATNNCIIGALKELISYYHSDSQAKYFCSIVDKKFQSTCNNTTNAYYSLF